MVSWDAAFVQFAFMEESSAVLDDRCVSTGTCLDYSEGPDDSMGKPCPCRHTTAADRRRPHHD